MKRPLSLTTKLTLMIELIMVLFSLLVAGLFLMSGHSLLTKHVEHSLVEDTQVVAARLTQALRYEETSLEDAAASQTLQSVLSLCSELIHSEITLLDGESHVYTFHEDAMATPAMDSLPVAVQDLAKDGLQGEGRFLTQTVDNQTVFYNAAPIFREDGKIMAVLVLSSPFANQESLDPEWTALLLSMGIALLLICAVCILFARSFLRPIQTMNRVARTLAEGDYTVTTAISRRDEIGQLALSMDTLAGELEQARQERERAQEAQQTFLRQISHELKTPISIIRCSLETFTENIISTSTEAKKAAGQMLSQILWIQKLVCELLDLTRLQTPNFRLDFSPLDLTELLGDVVMSARMLASKKHQQVLCQPPTQPCMVEGDYDRLRQLLMILVDNAVRYAPPDSAITLMLNEEEGTLSIADEGPGLAADVLPHLFEPYARGKSLQSTGLGLAIAKEIAERHGFTLREAPNHPTGEVFTLCFGPEGKV